ncbi:hypothetical protein [Ornithinibacillus sp. 179-J 7C1 HS]|uniref:hypothetical protein n=1 Tax=Ornithinibacillus sp. 179-J 7C1 HS TaxID=3142384 RepID=UPI0039A21FF2
MRILLALFFFILSTLAACNTDNSAPNIDRLDPYRNQGDEDVHLETRALQKTIPRSQEENNGSSNIENISNTPDIPVPRLLFETFKDRWNAITDMQLSELYISEIIGVSTAEGVYLAPLTNNMNLYIMVENGTVTSLEVKSGVGEKQERMMMLAAWAQIIMMLHPEHEIHDLDAFFNEIGVGPNGDLSNVKEMVYPYYHLQYEILIEENEYTFRASFRKDIN